MSSPIKSDPSVEFSEKGESGCDDQGDEAFSTNEGHTMVSQLNTYGPDTGPINHLDANPLAHGSESGVPAPETSKITNCTGNQPKGKRNSSASLKDSGSTLGGPKPAESTLGAPKPTGSTLGTPKPAGSTLGAPKPTGSTLGAPKPTGSTLGAPKPAGSTLGAPKPAGSTLGAPKPAGSTLGAPKPTGSTLGAPKPTGSTLGAPKPTGSTLGAPKPAGSTLGAPKPTGSTLGAPKPTESNIEDPKITGSTSISPNVAESAGTALLTSVFINENVTTPGTPELVFSPSEQKSQLSPANATKSRGTPGPNMLSEGAMAFAKLSMKVATENKEPAQPKQVKAAQAESKRNNATLDLARQQIFAREEQLRIEREERERLEREEHQRELREKQLAEAKAHKVKSSGRPAEAKAGKLSSAQSERLSRLGDIYISGLGQAKPKLAQAEKPKYLKAEDENQDISEPIEPSMLRSPICCVLGHVDAGKTKLLDRLRSSRVQLDEVGGITQQIGATMFGHEMLKNLISRSEWSTSRLELPGLLLIDTPGHASFANLRDRGSTLADIAVLVVDIFRGLEQMTLESIQMLRARKTPFVVALNKVDLIYGWRPMESKSIKETIESQHRFCQDQIEDRVASLMKELESKQRISSELYYRIPSLRQLAKIVSIVPTSATTGDGISDLISVISTLCQQLMRSKLLRTSVFNCVVLEAKRIEGLGFAVDAILIEGSLTEGSRIALGGTNEAIVTTIRACFVAGSGRQQLYKRVNCVDATTGFRFSADRLEKVVAGGQLEVIPPDADNDKIEEIRARVQEPIDRLLHRINSAIQDSSVSVGVHVQASTLGSLEALLDHLCVRCKIPVVQYGVGPVQSRDVKLASVVSQRNEDYGVILAFDVPVTQAARELASNLHVRIFESQVIYSLEEEFTKYLQACKDRRKKEAVSAAIFPCILEIKQECVYHKRDPLIVGITVRSGILHKNTPLAIYSDTQSQWLGIGTVMDIKKDDKPVEILQLGEEASICVSLSPGALQIYYGRHFDYNNELVSLITRHSLDALKEFHPDFARVPTNFSLLKWMKEQFKIN